MTRLIYPLLASSLFYPTRITAQTPDVIEERVGFDIGEGALYEMVLP